LKKNPPNLALSLLKLFSIESEKFSILDDIIELYEEKYIQHGCSSANIWIWIQVIFSTSPFIIYSIYRSNIMFNNYLKTSFRNIKKHKLYSAINVFGLSIGLSLFILLINFVRSESSYDRFHSNIDNIYRVLYSSLGRISTATNALLAGALEDEIPEITSAFRMNGISAFVTKNNSKIRETILLTDPIFVEEMTFPLISGQASTDNFDNNSIYISRKIADNYINTSDPIGEVLTIDIGNESRDFVVKGVLEDIPSNSSLQFDILMNFEQQKNITSRDIMNYWDEFFFSTFAVLHEESDLKQLGLKLKPFISKYFTPVVNSLGTELETFSLEFQPFADYHLGTMPNGNALSPRFQRSNVLILFGLAILVLLIACINFMNLSLARVSSRFKEISVRKVFGALRNQLIKQFLLESIMLSLFGLIAGLVFHDLFRPTFSSFIGKQSPSIFPPDLQTGLILLVLTFGLGIITGIYPAFVISKYQPVEAITGKIRINKGRLFTQGLVIFQYALSIFLISLTVYMNHQLNFVKNMDLGFDHESVIVLNTGTNQATKEEGERLYTSFKSELSQNTGISDISAISFSFARGAASTTVKLEEKNTRVFYSRVDENFIKTMNIKLFCVVDPSTFLIPISLIRFRILISARANNPRDAIRIPMNEEYLIILDHLCSFPY